MCILYLATCCFDFDFRVNIVENEIESVSDVKLLTNDLIMELIPKVGPRATFLQKLTLLNNGVIFMDSDCDNNWYVEKIITCFQRVPTQNDVTVNTHINTRFRRLSDYSKCQIRTSIGYLPLYTLLC